MFVIVYNERVILGPMVWNARRFSEVIDTLNNDVSQNIYEKLVDSIGEFNKDVINKNKRNMYELCKK